MLSKSDEKEDRKEEKGGIVVLPSGFNAREEGECFCIYWQYEEHPSAMLPIKGITAKQINKAIRVIKRQKGLE